jgi:hypothetical protein
VAGGLSLEQPSVAHTYIRACCARTCVVHMPVASAISSGVSQLCPAAKPCNVCCAAMQQLVVSGSATAGSNTARTVLPQQLRLRSTPPPRPQQQGRGTWTRGCAQVLASAVLSWCYFQVCLCYMRRGILNLDSVFSMLGSSSAMLCVGGTHKPPDIGWHMSSL